jgi:hypothetical protein
MDMILSILEVGIRKSWLGYLEVFDLVRTRSFSKRTRFDIIRLSLRPKIFLKKYFENLREMFEIIVRNL